MSETKYRIMTIAAKKDKNQSLYKYLLDGNNNICEYETKAAVDEKVETMLNEEDYIKSNVIVINELDFKVYSDIAGKQIGTEDTDEGSNGDPDEGIDGQEKPLYSFAAVSDVHVYLPDDDWGNASEDLKKLYVQAEAYGADFIACSGDLTYENTADELNNFKNILAGTNSSIPFYTCKGNHDNMGDNWSAEEWKEFTGCDENFIVKKDEDVFIFLSLSEASVEHGITDEAVAWLYDQLEENKNKRCFIFVHAPFENTCGDPNNLYYNSIFTTTSGNNQKLWFLANKYANTFWFNGHTHVQLSCVDLDSSSNIYWKPNMGKMIHVPALAVPRGDDDGNGVLDNYNENGEYYFVDVYKDKIILKGRDVVNDKYIEEARYVIKTKLKEYETSDDLYTFNTINCKAYNNAVITGIDEIRMDAPGGTVSENTYISVPTGKELYAKCDGITLSTGDTDLSKLAFTFTFYTDETRETELGSVSDYNCYLDETKLVCANGYIPDETCKYMKITFKSSSSYAGEVPVTAKIDNFRIYAK